MSCPAKLIESGGCCRRILARQGDPWTWDGRVPWVMAPLPGSLEVRLALWNKLASAGASGDAMARWRSRRSTGLVRPTWICSSRPPWDDTSGAHFTAGQGCIQAGFVWPFPARILASGRWMGRWIERWILLWITLWISD